MEIYAQVSGFKWISEVRQAGRVGRGRWWVKGVGKPFFFLAPLELGQKLNFWTNFLTADVGIPYVWGVRDFPCRKSW